MTLFPGVALITDAASGIGRATALAFAISGCQKIAIADRSVEELVQTQDSIAKEAPNAAVETIVVNVAQPESVAAMTARIATRWGRIDYAVNAAGIQGPAQRSTELTLDEFDEINNVNYRGLWLCSRAELAQMLTQTPLPSHDSRPGNRGAIVHIASQLGVVSRSTAPAYCASKSAVISLTRSDAIDYSKENIRINCVCPGLVETPMTQGSSEQRELFASAIATAPMNRMGQPSEIADVCLFLCSSKASFVQGASLLADGGYTIN
ncbi:unnamed protein product [Penicillium nalgiovense]|nr:unnamed protein product [Penicillium nalgiovense]